MVNSSVFYFSDAAEYFPSCNISPLFNIVYETRDEHARKTEWQQLKTFEVLSLEGNILNDSDCLS